MKWVGAFFRWILTINTIWGLMIVIAFALTVWDHFVPSTTVVPNSLLKEGENKITVKITNEQEKKVRTTELLVTVSGGKLSIPDKSRAIEGESAYLISAVQLADSTKLTWDANAYGPYQVEVNGTAVGKKIQRMATLQGLSDSALAYAKKAFDIGIGLVAAMVLFLGLMKVAEDAGIVQYVAKLFRPLIRLLYPDIPPDHPAAGAVLMNMTTSVLGIGNAATPFGLKAMTELQKLNPNKNIASDSQVMLLGWNTAGFALIPTTLIAIRQSAHCSRPQDIIGPCLLGGLCSTIAAVICVKLLGKLPFFSIRAALAEEAREAAAAAAPAGAEKEEEKEGVNA